MRLKNNGRRTRVRFRASSQRVIQVRDSFGDGEKAVHVIGVGKQTARNFPCGHAGAPEERGDLRRRQAGQLRKRQSPHLCVAEAGDRGGGERRDRRRRPRRELIGRQGVRLRRRQRADLCVAQPGELDRREAADRSRRQGGDLPRRERAKLRHRQARDAKDSLSCAR